MGKEKHDSRGAENAREIGDRIAGYVASIKQEIKFGRLLRIEKRVESGGDPNRPSRWGDLDLVTASAHCNRDPETDERALKTLKMLLEAGAEVNGRDSGGQTALFEAGGGALLLLLDNGADPNLVDQYGATPLNKAVRKGSLSDARTLLDGGAKCSDWPIGRFSAIQWAVECDEIDIARLLLDRGANVTEVDSEGQGLMHLARSLECAKLLVSAGAPCDVSDYKGRSVLHRAVDKWRSEEMIRFLIAEGAPIDAVDHRNKTALILAVETEQQEIVRLLLASGAKCSYWPVGGRSAVHWAIECKQTTQLKLLLENGADPKEVDRSEDSLIHFAVSEDRVDCSDSERMEIVQVLVGCGVPCDLVNNRGESVLLLAVDSGRSEEIIRYLIDNGAPINAVDWDLNTALVRAVIAGRTDLASALMECGAKVSHWPVYGKSAVQRAVRMLMFDMVTLAFEHGADPLEVDTYGRSLMVLLLRHDELTVSQESRCLQIAELLTKHGVPCDLLATHGDTALHWAAFCERSEEMMRFLLANGASLDAVDNDGRTALDVAIEYDKAQSIEILERLAGER